MVDYYISFDCVYRKISPCICKGYRRVLKAVPTWAYLFVVPVIQKIIVKQGTCYQRFFINRNFELTGNFKAYYGNVETVGKNRSPAMLDMQS